MTRRPDLLSLRVDQVGSLLRPSSLKDAFLACAKGALARDALDRLVEQAVREVVARQQAIGFPIVTDGEFGRINWHVSFSKIEGWALEGPRGLREGSAWWSLWTQIDAPSRSRGNTTTTSPNILPARAASSFRARRTAVAPLCAAHHVTSCSNRPAVGYSSFFGVPHGHQVHHLQG